MPTYTAVFNWESSRQANGAAQPYQFAYTLISILFPEAEDNAETVIPYMRNIVSLVYSAALNKNKLEGYDSDPVNFYQTPSLNNDETSLPLMDITINMRISRGSLLSQNRGYSNMASLRQINLSDQSTDYTTNNLIQITAAIADQMGRTILPPGGTIWDNTLPINIIIRLHR